MKESILYCHKREATHNRETVGADHWYGDCMTVPQSVKFYDRNLPIYELRVREVQDDEKSSYWAWWDNNKDQFTMLHYHRDLLSINFAYGIEPEVKRGKGKDYNVMIEELREIDPKSL
jgi:hypothetical protein